LHKLSTNGQKLITGKPYTVSKYTDMQIIYVHGAEKIFTFGQ